VDNKCDTDVLHCRYIVDNKCAYYHRLRSVVIAMDNNSIRMDCRTGAILAF
jgi:hypothetical protein